MHRNTISICLETQLFDMESSLQRKSLSLGIISPGLVRRKPALVIEDSED